MVKAMKKNPNEMDFKDAVDYAHDIIGDMNHGMQCWIGCTVYSTDVKAAAVKNEDGSIGVVMLNRTGSDTTVNLRISGRLIEAALPGNSLTAVTLSD